MGFCPGLWKYHARLVRLVPFHSGQAEKFNLLVLGQVQNLYKVNKIFVFHIFINYYEITCCIENSVDPDQLASLGASLSGSTLFTRELISAWFHTVFKRVKCLSTERYKLICTVGQVKFSLDKYIMAIYLSLDKYKILLFPHPCFCPSGLLS